ncbi:hypothetical protein PG279_02330 [Riemerella anatipestifer]|nr:hypothetical protein [Riemerella anatipestifer]
MKILNQVFVILIFVFFSCENSKLKPEALEDDMKENNRKSKDDIKIGNLFFDYDQIEYYKTNISESDALELLENRDNSKLNELKVKLILEGTPKNIEEVNFTNQLSQIGFKKMEIKSQDFSKINQIFVEKSERDGVALACAPIYRDILIFKKNKKIIGFVKICFDCKQSDIIGTKAITSRFGQGDDYEKLMAVLRLY